MNRYGPPAGKPPSPPGWTVLWVMLGATALLFAAGALLTLVGLVGLTGSATGPAPGSAPETATLQPTPVVLVVVPREEPTATPPMPAPQELLRLAETPLPPIQSSPTLSPGEHSSPLNRPEEAEEADIATATVTVTATAAPPPLTYRDLFQEAAAESGFDWRLLAALAYRESRLDPLAVGQDGEMGLMQILPSTWDEFAPPEEALEPFAPEDNVQVAVRYLVYLQDTLAKWGLVEVKWVLAAYNWGPDNVRQLLDRGEGWEQLPSLQRRYVGDILGAAFGPNEDD